MTEAEQKIGDYISECVNRGSFSVEDMEEVLALIKRAGYKSPEEVEELKEAIHKADQQYIDLLLETHGRLKE